MGGYNSGTWYRYNTKTTVEECRSIDINYLNRKGLLNGTPRELSWSRGNSDYGKIGIKAIGEAEYLRLFYTVDKDKDINYKVKLDKVPMNLGGHKLYLRCPDCNKRVEKLYLSNKSNYFLCRHCLDLTYSSSQNSGDEAAKIRRKLDKLYKKLGSKWKGVYSTIPDKPKNMHYKTYWKLRSKIIDYEIELDRVLASNLKKLQGYLDNF